MFQKLCVPSIINYIKIFQTYSDDCQSILDKEVEYEGDNTNEFSLQLRGGKIKQILHPNDKNTQIDMLGLDTPSNRERQEKTCFSCWHESKHAIGFIKFIIELT